MEERGKIGGRTESGNYPYFICLFNIGPYDHQKVRKKSEEFKTSWNNSNKVLVIQRRGRVLTDYKIVKKFA